MPTTTAAASAAQFASPSQAASVAGLATSSAALMPPAAPPGWFETGSLSFELVKGLPAVFVTLVIGAIAAYIAWRQFQVAAEQRRVAQAKLSLDLFQRRYEVFQHTWSMLSSMIQARPDQAKVEMDFNNARPHARFLFGAEIAECMADISRRRIDQQLIDATTRQPGQLMRPEDTQRSLENTTFFFNEASSGARDRFGRYLDFSEWR